LKDPLVAPPDTLVHGSGRHTYPGERHRFRPTATESVSVAEQNQSEAKHPANRPRAFADTRPASSEPPIAGTGRFGDDIAAEGTQQLSAEQLERAAAETAATHMPFEPNPSHSCAQDTQPGHQAIPGAPWAEQPAKRVPEPLSKQDRTVNLAEQGLEAFLPDFAPSTPDSRTDTTESAPPSDQDGTLRGLPPPTELDEKQKAAAEKAAAEKAAVEKAAAEKAAAEADARHRLEAQRFAEEQERAKLEQQRREEERKENKRQAAKELRENIYGGFKRKRKS
jgi:hypothetical protein